MENFSILEMKNYFFKSGDSKNFPRQKTGSYTKGARGREGSQRGAYQTKHPILFDVAPNLGILSLPWG